MQVTDPAFKVKQSVLAVNSTFPVTLSIQRRFWEIRGAVYWAMGDGFKYGREAISIYPIRGR